MRVRNSSKPGLEARTIRRYNADGVLTSTELSDCTWTNQDVMTDEVTPGFLERSRQGEIFIKPMSKTVSSGEARKVFFQCLDRANSQGKRSRWTADFFGGPLSANWAPSKIGIPSAAATSIAKVRALAITSAYAKVGEPDVSSLVTLVESRETLGFLWEPVRKMINLTKRGRRWLKAAERREQSYKTALARYNSLPLHIRKKRKQPEKRKNPPFRVGRWEATDISSFWLAYRYGLMPLIYEFQDWQKALSESPGTGDRETSRSTRSEAGQEVKWSTGSETLAWGKLRFDHEFAYKVKARAGVLYTPEYTWQRRFGVQLNRVPAALYEGIPLSFVADWFWNGIDVYNALTAECRAQRILGAWVVTTVDYEYTCRRIWWDATPGYTPSGGNGVCYRESGSIKTRTPTSLADVRVKLRLEMNAKRIADGLALIHTFISRRR